MNKSHAFTRTTCLASLLASTAAMLLPLAASAELLGVQPVHPLLSFSPGGSTTFDAATGHYDVAALPLVIVMAPGEAPIFIDPISGGEESVSISLMVQPGGAASGRPGQDLIITGAADLDGDGNVDVSGVLLEGEVNEFGFEDAVGTTDLYDFTFSVTGGMLLDQYPGGVVAVQLTSEGSDFDGTFATSFSGRAKGTLGGIDSGEACDLTLDKTCLVVVSANADAACEAKLKAMTLRYTGPTIAGLSVVEFIGKSGAVALYNDIELVEGMTLLDGQNGFSIDSAASNKGDLGSKTSIFINGVEEVIHTSCSVPVVAGAPAPLNSPKGAPSPNWYVERLLDKAGNDLGVPIQDFAQNCEIPAPGSAVCEDRPTEIVFRFNGGDCSQSDNSQDDGKWRCEDLAPVSGPVRVVIEGNSDEVYADVDNLLEGSVIVATAAMAGRDEFASEVNGWIYDAAGNLLQGIKLHTSCSQTLAIGDRFGSLEIAGFTNPDQGSVGGGSEVIYKYTITNLGEGTAFDLVVTDDSLDPQEVPGSPIASLDPQAMTMLMTSTFVDAEVNSTAMVTGTSAGGVVCTASDMLAVTIALPPPCQVSGKDELSLGDDKLEWEIRNDGSDDATLALIELEFPASLGTVEKIKFAGNTIFEGNAASPLVLDLSGVSAADRRIEAGDKEDLKIEFSDKDDVSPADFSIRLSFEEGCALEFVPTAAGDECNKPISQISMIWDGTVEPIRVLAYKGDSDDELLLDMDGIVRGTEVTVSGLAGSPNNVYWEIFSGGNLLGSSVFHLSCSDQDMQNSSDCGNRQGNGKDNNGDHINEWLLEGMVDDDGPFDCSNLP